MGRTPLGRGLLALATSLVLGAGTLLHTPAFGATPPPTPVPPHGSPSPFPTALATKPPSARRPPALGAKAAVLADLDSGQVLFAVKPDLRRPIASLTKIMTALLVLEGGRVRETVTVSGNAAPPSNQVGISNLGLVAGERISIEELLYALLLQSANDAAVALAEHQEGSVGGFVKAMNRRAKELGAADTRFASPNGLDDDGYSTARDLAAIMGAAMGEPWFRRISRTKFHTVPGPPGGKARRIQNRNVLLWLYPGTLAGKTGFTSRAGYCLVAVAERDGRTLVAVVLGERGESFSDAAELFDYGFQEFVPVDVAMAGETLGVREVGGTPIEVAAGEDLAVLVLRKDADRIRTRIRVDADAPALVLPGEPVGTVTAVGASGPLGSVDLVAHSSAAAVPWNRGFDAVLDRWAADLVGMDGG